MTLARIEQGAAVDAVTRETDADGRIADLGAGDLRAGSYELRFDVAAYFRKQGKEPAAFFSKVVLDIEIADANRRYHVPLLVTPYSCASYRGS